MKCGLIDFFINLLRIFSCFEKRTYYSSFSYNWITFGRNGYGQHIGLPAYNQSRCQLSIVLERMWDRYRISMIETTIHEYKVDFKNNTFFFNNAHVNISMRIYWISIHPHPSGLIYRHSSNGMTVSIPLDRSVSTVSMCLHMRHRSLVALLYTVTNLWLIKPEHAEPRLPIKSEADAGKLTSGRGAGQVVDMFKFVCFKMTSGHSVYEGKPPVGMFDNAFLEGYDRMIGDFNT